MAGKGTKAAPKAAPKAEKPQTQEKNGFVISKAMMGKGITINVTFPNGRKATYNHDEAVVAMQKHRNLDEMNCWNKYGNYTSSKSVPRPIVDLESTTYDKSGEIKEEEKAA